MPASPTTADVACSATHLSVAYGATLILRDVTVEVPTGVVSGVVGPNGAGKSTLLKALLGLVPPLAGDVRMFGQPLDAVRSRIGYVPQSANLDWDFPTTVHAAVLMGTYAGLGWLRRPGKAERAATADALAAVGLEDLHGRAIGELSGGQKQRVLLARSLAGDPDLLLMDEPFAGVDAVSQQAIVDVLHGLRQRGKTVILVHHDLATVRDYCDHVTLINRRIVASGPVDHVFTPEALRETYDVTPNTHHPLWDTAP